MRPGFWWTSSRKATSSSSSYGISSISISAEIAPSGSIRITRVLMWEMLWTW